MDFWQTVLVLFRRWYVVVPVFLVTIGAALAVYSAIPTKYVSNAVLVLTAPRGGPTLIPDERHPAGITNPMLNFDQGLSTSASIIIQALTTPETAIDVGARPGSATSFQVTNGSTNPELLMSAPFIFIEGDSTAPNAAKNVVAKIVQRAKTELANRQANLDAPRPTYISMVVVVGPTTPQGKRGGKARPAAMALGVGMVLSLAAAYGVESFATARRRRGAAEARAADARAGQARAGQARPGSHLDYERIDVPPVPSSTSRH